MALNPAFWRGKRVLLTGHTGFKGSWLALWLQSLGARVTGFSLDIPTEPSLFDALRLSELLSDVRGDVRDPRSLQKAMHQAQPEIVLHLAAQSLVRQSYAQPVETYATNVMGTAHILEASRAANGLRAVVIVTSDKCYENREWELGYRENDPLGGHDIYSCSKGMAELVVAGFRRSFFPPDRLDAHGVALASARAGNVLGGGDWASDRIVPDAVRALERRLPISVRNPDAVRPWQHVLEPLSGYLLLGMRLSEKTAERAGFCEAWNFGPHAESQRTVRDVVETILRFWGEGSWRPSREEGPHEAGRLALSIEKAQTRLGWNPRWSFEETIDRTVRWYQRWRKAEGAEALRALMLSQIRDYTGGVAAPEDIEQGSSAVKTWAKRE